MRFIPLTIVLAAVFSSLAVIVDVVIDPPFFVELFLASLVALFVAIYLWGRLDRLDNSARRTERMASWGSRPVNKVLLLSEVIIGAARGYDACRSEIAEMLLASVAVRVHHELEPGYVSNTRARAYLRSRLGNSAWLTSALGERLTRGLVRKGSQQYQGYLSDLSRLVDALEMM